MKTLGLALALVMLAQASSAQTRLSTTNMSCAAANSLVLSQGAAVLGTGGDTFDRFVRDSRFCAPGQKLRPAFVPARDQRQCMVGWLCYDEPQEDR